MNTKHAHTSQTNGNDSELRDDELEQVIGGTGLLSSPLGSKGKPATQMWTREIVEDVEAY